MSGKLAVFVAMALFCGRGTFGQTFEVASVKLAAEGRAGASRPGAPSANVDPGLVTYQKFSLKDLLIRAYGVKNYEVQGPAWIATERYDVSARVPEGVSADRIPAMLQNLLVERFRISMHWETRDEPVYALVAGKGGPKLKKSAKELEPEIGGNANLVANSLDDTSAGLRMPEVTLPIFANTLATLINHPILDMTGIQGTFDITLNISMETLAGMRGAASTSAFSSAPEMPGNAESVASAPTNSLFAAIKELGLVLETRRAPVKHLVIESALKVPTEN